MKRVLTTTTALSLALSPLSGIQAFAQVALDLSGETVICLPNAETECPEGEICVMAVEGTCEGDEVIRAAEEALLDAKAQAAEAAALAEAEAAKLAEAAEAEAAAAAAEAEKAAAAEAAQAAEDAAKLAAESEAKAAEEALAAQQAEAEAKALAEEEAAKLAEAEAEAREAAEAEAAKLAEEEAKAAEAAAAAAAETAVAVEPAVEATTALETSAETDTTTATETTTAVESTDAPVTSDVETVAAETPAETPEPVDVLVPEEEAVSTLENLLTDAATQEDAPVAAAAEATDGTDQKAAGAGEPVSEPTVETVTEITEEDSRSSTEEFAAAPTIVSAGKKSGLSDLEKFGLVALGALVVGSVLKNGDKVVSNSGDRVVVEREDGSFQVLKDDDTLLRQPGSRLRTETFSDGSTRTILERDDGSRIVTIRDASGRVLRRARVAVDGTETLLIDDLTRVEKVEIATLPAPKTEMTISASDDGVSLQKALDAIAARENYRRFSLRQIRDYREVRALAPTINVDNITFRTGSSAIDVSEAEKLAQLGELIAGVVRDRPYELFLIEGHTDAVGSASSNLSLSDRRAESVALALTEYFGVPPENLVVQGYGEGELRVPTLEDEVRNRRVAVRLISPLMQNALLR